MSHSLDYARSDLKPRTTRNKFASYVVLMVLASLVFAAGGSSRTIPGGPFISITANLLPFVVSTAAIILYWPNLRSPLLSLALLFAVVILAAVAAIIFVVIDVISFYYRPCARGDLFGL